MRRRDVHGDDMFDDDPLLSAFGREVRDATEQAPLPAVGATLAAVLDGRAPAVSYPDVATPGADGTRRVWQVRVRLGLAAVGLAAAVLALAAAGTLPDPAQRQVARLASAVGLELPDGGDEDGEPVETTTTTSTTVAPTTTTAPSTTTSITPPPTTVVTAPVVPATPPTSVDDRPGRGDDRDDDRGRGDEDDRDDPRDDEDEDEDDGNKGDDDRSGPGDGDRDEDDSGDDEVTTEP